MRKPLSVPLLAALMGTMFLLCACSAAPAEAPAFAPIPRPSGGGDIQSAQVEAMARPLSDEEILDAYDQAEEIYGWFELEPLPSGSITAVADGVLYRQVNRNDLQTLDDLRTCLRSVFSQDLTDRLLSTGGEVPRYRDIEDALYVTGVGRDRLPGKGSVTPQVERTAENSYSVNVTVDLLDESGEVTGLECWSFPYVFEEDRWVFTDFRLVY